MSLGTCRWLTVAVSLLAASCSGESFTSRATGGAAGSGASGGASSGGAGGSGGGATGGSGGGSASGGCGPAAGQELLLYSTLDDGPSISNPATGTASSAGYSTIPADDFVKGRCGKAIQLDEANEYVRFGENGNFDITRGKIDFWYLPASAHTDGLVHRFFYSSGAAATSGLSIRKNNLNAFTASIRDSGGAYVSTEVASDAYAFVPGQWVRITVTWDVESTTQAAHVYFDGEEPAYVAAPAGPIAVQSPPSGAQMFVGTANEVSADVAGGAIDDFKIYGTTTAP